jgi:tetratricopeptide (TPR) repeat protein
MEPRRRVSRRFAFYAALLLFLGVSYRYVYLPCRCNYYEPRLERDTIKLDEAGRRNFRALAQLEQQALRLLEGCPENVPLIAIAAANAQLRGANERASALYREAMKYDHRPELYLQLGLVEGRMGNRSEALKYLVAAARFDPSVVRAIDDPQLLVDTLRTVERSRPRRSNELRNGTFALAGRSTRTRLETTAAEPMRGDSAAAAEWAAVNNVVATTSTELMPSTLTPGGNMLRVVTTNAYCGLVQVWHAPNSGPTAVDSQAWVFVRRGRVFIGTGNGAGAQTPNATSVSTGRWELIRGPNASCPANQTVIYARDEGGADFDVANVVVKADPDRLCYD